MSTKLTPEEEKAQADKMNSFGMRFEKSIGSMVAGTSGGRKIIAQFVGEAGNEVISTMKEAVGKHFGKSAGKELKEDVFKIAVKVKLMLDNKVLLPREASHAEQPVNSLCIQFLKFLETKPGNINPKPLCANINRIGSIIGDILEKKMKRKNLDKMLGIFQKLADEKFMTNLLNHKDYDAFKKVLLEKMRILVAPILKAEAKDDKPCTIKGCKETQAQPKDKFSGSKFCPAHHRQRHKDALAKPTLHRFIESDADRSSKFFTNFLSSSDPASLLDLNFYSAVQKFKEVTNAGLRKTRAEQLFAKFLAPTLPANQKVPCDAKELKAIEGSLVGDHASTSVFKNVQDQAVARLDTVFKNKFLASTFYKQFVDSVELPPDYEKMADAAKIDDIKLPDVKADAKTDVKLEVKPSAKKT